MFGGGVSISGGSVGVGGTVGVTVLDNTVSTDITGNTVITAMASAGGAGVSSPQNRKQKRRGVYIGANGKNTVVLAAVSAAAGDSNVTVGGSVTTLVIKSRSRAKVTKGVKIAAASSDESEDGQPASSDDADIEIKASDDTIVFGFAGSARGLHRRGRRRYGRRHGIRQDGRSLLRGRHERVRQHLGRRGRQQHSDTSGPSASRPARIRL